MGHFASSGVSCGGARERVRSGYTRSARAHVRTQSAVRGPRTEGALTASHHPDARKAARHPVASTAWPIAAPRRRPRACGGTRSRSRRARLPPTRSALPSVWAPADVGVRRVAVDPRVGEVRPDRGGAALVYPSGPVSGDRRSPRPPSPSRVGLALAADLLPPAARRGRWCRRRVPSVLSRAPFAQPRALVASAGRGPSRRLGGRRRRRRCLARHAAGLAAATSGAPSCRPRPLLHPGESRRAVGARWSLDCAGPRRVDQRVPRSSRCSPRDPP